MTSLRSLVAIVTLAGSTPALTAADDAAGVEFFESNVRPVLVKHCYECHSVEAGAEEGGLRVDTREAIRAGGDRGPAVVPENPDSSLLLTAVTHADPDLQMPPKQEKLSANVIADLRKWIEMGAPDPRDGQAARPGGVWADLESAREFWSYQPPRDATPPDVSDPAWPRSDIDRFVLSQLDEQGLAPSPDADPHVLLRRVYFDLVGLPPAPEDLSRFTAAINSQGMNSALAAEVDRLLALPQYGERWGRHWLDVARFGESSGKESNISFPYAWRYRDYVIDSIDADVPYDRFLTEQIAGDLLPYETEGERARLLIATGFLAVGTKNLDEGNGFQFLADVVDEQIDTVTRAVLGNSVACARCHDHKFDPYSMQDYYALAGVFVSTKTYFGTAVSPANRVGGDPLPLPQLDAVPVYHEGIPQKQVAKLKDELAAMEQEEQEKRAAVQKAIEAGEDASGIFTLRDALRIFWRRGAIDGQLEKVDDEGNPLPLGMGVLEREEMIDAPLLDRGDISKAGDPVPRGFPRIIAIDEVPAIPEDQSGRLELAQWLTHPDNPLTARVMVNRIWHHLLGAGLVRTVDNFGMTGEAPSHPELLDTLAVEFMQNGWSIKQMVRQIVLSRTYRQSSEFRDQAFQQDPDNRLLWRVPKRRLEAEAIRDAMLAASGELDLSRPEASLVGRVIGDKPISLIGLDERLPKDLDGSVHRSVYLPVIRDRLPDVLELFDFAEPSLVTGSRETTNVPTQALYLMNSPFIRERSEALADRLIRESSSETQRIDLAFRLCLGRAPDDYEQRRAVEFLESSEPPAEEGVDADRETLINFCQAMFATAEFRNLD